jgi:hypothetical protein
MEGENCLAQKDMLSARERRLRRAATRRGLSIRKVDRGQDCGRYLIVDPQFGGAKGSANRAHPQSFSLQEAEAYIVNESVPRPERAER